MPAMLPPDKLLSAARKIRPYIPELLDASLAQSVDKQLEALLSAAISEQSVDQQIQKLLAEHETTREWLRLYVEENYPADGILKVIRTYYPLPDTLHAVESPRYLCPVASCHQEWYRRDRDQAIPNCPIHDVQFVRDSKGHS